MESVRQTGTASYFEALEICDQQKKTGLFMGHIYLSHSHPIAIYACPIPWDVSHGIPIGMTFPWTSLEITQ